MWACTNGGGARHWDGRGRWSEGELDGTWRDRGPVNSINFVFTTNKRVWLINVLG